MKSSGESDGTLVTMPVPLNMEIDSIGSDVIVAYGVSGARSGTPISSVALIIADATPWRWKTGLVLFGSRHLVRGLGILF